MTAALTRNKVRANNSKRLLLRSIRRLQEVLGGCYTTVAQAAFEIAHQRIQLPPAIGRGGGMLYPLPELTLTDEAEGLVRTRKRDLPAHTDPQRKLYGVRKGPVKKTIFRTVEPPPAVLKLLHWLQVCFSTTPRLTSSLSLTGRPCFFLLPLPSLPSLIA